MELHNLKQGSAEWHTHRLTHFNASDAPAMMGCSAYKTRSQLLHEIHTGIAPDVDSATQRRFDDGHRFEALARPLAEEIIGDDLYPVVGSLGKLSASFDGLTMDRKVAFEHKTLNDDLRSTMHADLPIGVLPLQYRVQMEQQLRVAGAEQCLFMATKWQGEELIEERHAWYYSDDTLLEAIERGWEQFESDLAAYVPPVAEVKAVAAPQFGLPAVSIQVNGSIALIDNLQVFGTALIAYVERINKSPETDQDFADLEATVKTLKNAEDALDAAETGALAQTESIDTMRRTVAMYRDTARTNRLLIDKLVKSEKEARKLAIVSEAAAELVLYVKSLNAQLGASYMPAITSDFPGAVKGLKSIDSMRDKVATELARCKIEAKATADRIQTNTDAIRAAGYGFLFADVQALCTKDPEFVVMTIKTRIDAHQAAEAARLEAETARIAEQERVKAERIAQARADAEIAAAARKAADERAAEQYRVNVANEARAAEQAKAAAEAAIEVAQHPAVIAATESFDEDVRVILTKASEPAVQVRAGYIGSATPATQPTLKIDQISTRMGFQVTADFLRTLGFEPAGRDRAAVLYHDDDFPAICLALIEHIESVLGAVAA